MIFATLSIVELDGLTDDATVTITSSMNLNRGKIVHLPAQKKSLVRTLETNPKKHRK
jgi:hypothetical protein